MIIFERNTSHAKQLSYKLTPLHIGFDLFESIRNNPFLFFALKCVFLTNLVPHSNNPHPPPPDPTSSPLPPKKSYKPLYEITKNLDDCIMQYMKYECVVFVKLFSGWSKY